MRELLARNGRFDGRSRWAVVAVALAMGVGALFGGYGLLSDAEGLGLEEAWLRGPFDDYTVPGLFLLVVIGGGMLALAVLGAARSRWSALGALAMSAVLAAWLVIETAVIGYRGAAQLPLLVLCGGSAAVLLLLGGRRLRRPRSPRLRCAPGATPAAARRAPAGPRTRGRGPARGTRRRPRWRRRRAA